MLNNYLTNKNSSKVDFFSSDRHKQRDKSRRTRSSKRELGTTSTTTKKLRETREQKSVNVWKMAN